MNVEFVDRPLDVGVHPTCYRRFTDTFRITSATRRCEKKKEDPLITTDTSTDIPGPSPKKLRSKSKSLAPSSKPSESSTSKSRSVLPAICIICKKAERYCFEKLSRKRTKDKLTQAETESAGLLRRAAELKKDESILRHIRDQDCVAIEVRYHRKCYSEYTRFLTDPIKGTEVQKYQKYTTAYKIYCNEIVEKRLIQDQEILRMRKLHEIFVRHVRKHEHCDASNYRPELLKSRLKKDYPQLQFYAPRKKNESEMVYVETLQPTDLFDILPSASGTDTTDTTETETEGSSGSTPKQKVIVSQNIATDMDSLRSLFNSGLILRNVIKDTPAMQNPWPPTAQNLTLESVKSMVPVILYNFIAWCIGASDEITMTEFIKVNSDIDIKLLSICQDLIYLASNGRKQTPKSLCLGLASKHLTGSSRLLTILNRLGHSTSANTVNSLETALALLELDDQAKIPSGFEKGVCTVLVWDNIDFSEETLSGHGTTHHTNGIMLQRRVIQHEIESRPNIPKGQKSLKPQVLTLDKYVMYKKEEPQMPENCPDIDEKFFLAPLLPGKKKNLAFILCKMVDEELASVPGWTGFNTVMQSDPPLQKSAIYYLPVIPASPTDLGTVKTIFTRSLELADKLELKYCFGFRPGHIFQSTTN